MHVLHVVVAPEQVAQGDVHARQVLPDAIVPDGHEPTHVLPLRKSPEIHDVQDVVVPEQVVQGDVHATQLEVPETMEPEGHDV